jgi:hypothetical protein
MSSSVSSRHPYNPDSTVFEVHEQVAGLLDGPCAVGVGGHAEDVHVPGCHLHDEQHVQAPEEDGVDVKEVAGQ